MDSGVDPDIIRCCKGGRCGSYIVGNGSQVLGRQGFCIEEEPWPLRTLFHGDRGNTGFSTLLQGIFHTLSDTFGKIGIRQCAIFGIIVPLEQYQTDQIA